MHDRNKLLLLSSISELRQVIEDDDIATVLGMRRCASSQPDTATAGVVVAGVAAGTGTTGTAVATGVAAGTRTTGTAVATGVAVVFLPTTEVAFSDSITPAPGTSMLVMPTAVAA